MSDLLTLTEAAELSGYSREALKQRVRRGKLLSVKGNDGLVRVKRSDITELPPAPQADESEDDTATALVSVISKLRDDLATSRDVAETLRDQLEATRDKARVDLEQARKEAGDLREQAARLDAERDADRRRAEAAEARLQEEVAARREAESQLREAQKPWIVRVIRSLSSS